MPRSTWYHNINALKRVGRHARLKDKIREIYHYHNGRYGYRRITLSLRKQGVGKHELSNFMESAQKLALDKLSNDSC
ncbi:transposase [Escherichia coli O104]|nr:transposase [Escherichia coli]EKF4568281.1 transposase [Escherichia coli O104]EFI2769852.1 transposase [Escherichia coli]EFI2779340.1 transposase [Escherichia coli]EFI2787552.1 transposase [Escherichia coli]